LRRSRSSLTVRSRSVRNAAALWKKYFKGSGWYVNDYGGKKADPSTSISSGEGGSESSASKATEKTDKKSDSKAQAKSESKSESKPEPKKTETKRGRAKR
jgi:predicted nucleic acid-binding Zn ribbon protein